MTIDIVNRVKAQLAHMKPGFPPGFDVQDLLILALDRSKPLTRAILDGARQIATPAFVSTLSICIVFVSVVFLTGPARYLSRRWLWRWSSP